MAESVWKTKPHIHLTIWSNNQDSRHLPKGYESICLHKHLYKHSVYISFIHNWWNLEAIKMIFSRWMNNQTVVHLHIEIKSKALFYKDAHRKRGGTLVEVLLDPLLPWALFMHYLLFCSWELERGRTTITPLFCRWGNWGSVRWLGHGHLAMMMPYSLA